jgi:hypothetical protein
MNLKCKKILTVLNFWVISTGGSSTSRNPSAYPGENAMEEEYLSIRAVERGVLDNLGLMCRIFWRMSSPETQQKYPRFGEEAGDAASLEEEVSESEDNVLVGYAFTIFAALDSRSDIWSATEPDTWLRELSLFMCRLAGSATVSDVEHYFVRRLRFEEKNLSETRFVAALRTPPAWVSAAVRRSMERYRRFKEMDASFYMEREAKLSGGDSPLTFRGRVSLYLNYCVQSSEEGVERTRSILEEVRQGNYLPAILDLNENLEAAAEAYEAALQAPVATFLRQEGDGIAVDGGVVESNYHLLTSLLEVLQPTSGHA